MLALLVWASLCSANQNPHDTLRLTLPFANPLTHWDALAESYRTAQQGIGVLDRALVEHWGNPGAGFPRLGEMLAVAWPNLAVGYYTHELGHDINSEWWGSGYHRHIHWGDWFPQPWPLYEREVPFETRYDSILNAQYSVDWTALDEWWLQVSWHVVRGIDQEEWDAVLLYQQGNDALSWDEAMAFLFRKVSALTYELYSGGAWGTSFASGTSDATGYVENLIDRRIQANRWDWYGPALFSTALSFRFWESLWMDLRFLAGGPRVIHPWSYTHNGWRITPPLVELAYTPWGAWHQMHLPIQTPGGWQIETLFGHDVDWMAAGQLRTWRIGANLSTPSWPLGQCRLRYELGGAYTLRHSPMAYAGYATHATLRLQMRRLEISLEARRSEGDLEENGIHARPEGMEIYSGMSWLY